LPIFGEKLAFCSKTNVLILFFAKNKQQFEQKNAIFSQNILKIITLVPDLD
jgi:hypothetical protein